MIVTRMRSYFLCGIIDCEIRVKRTRCTIVLQFQRFCVNFVHAYFDCQSYRFAVVAYARSIEKHTALLVTREEECRGAM